MSQQTISAESNPALLAALAQSATSDSPSMEDSAPAAVPPSAEPPMDNVVELPAGYLDLLSDEVTSTAEVRELNGADEEALAKAAGGNFAKILDVVLQRGVVSICDQPAKPLLDQLLSGDRDALLLAVRNVTYGPELEFGAVCPSCETRQQVTLDLTEDVPMRRLENPKERTFEVELRRGRALVSLPNGATQRDLFKADTKTTAELNTVLLAACVVEINGQPVLGPSQVREGLGVRDRETLLKAISERVPGPRLMEVSKPCRSCGESMPLPLTLADLFRR